MMCKLLFFLTCWAQCLYAETELLVIGDQSQPVPFMVLPLDYEGPGLSPTVVVENSLTQALSSTGLFTMPMRHTPPDDPNDLLAWRLIDIRFVIQGKVIEDPHGLFLQLSIFDTLGLQPVQSTALLNPDNLSFSVQAFADQLYRSLFYATFTNDNDKQYLENENPTLTRYLNATIQHLKWHWPNSNLKGECQVRVEQLPGGTVFKHKLQPNCFQNPKLAEEIETLFNELSEMPYEGYQSVFLKDLLLTFIRP